MLVKKLTKYQILFLKKSKRDLKSKMDINREDIVLPRKNYSIRGHKENINFLINSFLNNSLHHAYIFSGNKGIGKATLAYLLSRKILSDNKTKKLEVFDYKVSKLIEANSHPDLLVIEPEDNDKKSSNSA